MLTYCSASTGSCLTCFTPKPSTGVSEAAPGAEACGSPAAAAAVAVGDSAAASSEGPMKPFVRASIASCARSAGCHARDGGPCVP